MKRCKSFWIAIFLIAVLGLAGCMHSVIQKEGGAGGRQSGRGGY